MNYKQALTEAAKQGAIRVYPASKGWHVVYRVKSGQIQARNINKINDNDWELGDSIAGFASGDGQEGWLPAEKVHFGVTPIENEAAKENPGYYHGISRRCETCKKDKSPAGFSRDVTGEAGFRSWECDECAESRNAEVAANQAVRAGDIIRRETHASNPPVEGEI